MRYTGPRLKIVRRLGLVGLPALTTKKVGKTKKKKKKKKRPKSFLLTNRLKEKQKLHYNFNINNHQLFNYIKQAKKISGLAAKIKAKEKKEPAEIKETLNLPKPKKNLMVNKNKKNLDSLEIKKNLKYNRLFLISDQETKKNFSLTSDLPKRKKILDSTQTQKHVGSTGDELIKLLESRFDSIIFRLYFAPTLNLARQLITHGHFLINKKKVNIPSYHCNVNDEIRIRSKSKDLIKNLYFKITKANYLEAKKKMKPKQIQKYINRIPFYLKFDKKTFVTTMTNDVSYMDNTIRRYYYYELRLRILYVIEFFSRQL